MRIAAHGLLALIAVVLLSTGLAMMSAMAIPPSPVGGQSLAMTETAGESAAKLRSAPPEKTRPRRALPAGEAPALQNGRPADGARSPAAFHPPRAAPPKRRPVSDGDGRGDAGEALLAVVIDDIGHSLDTTRHFLALGQPLTFSVLPGVRHAASSADLIDRAGREFLIHLPMQPFDYPNQNPGPLPLLLSQSLEKTELRVREYLELLPGASGASNHMGSAYTYNPERMHRVQTVLAERNLFFLNSRTSGTTVPGAIAAREGFAYLERDVFLDHDPAEGAIEGYFHRAVRVAARRGRAIAIGHPYPQTYRVLQRNLPRLASMGVRLVTLSDLMYR